jgi:hypothetical protein
MFVERYLMVDGLYSGKQSDRTDGTECHRHVICGDKNAQNTKTHSHAIL